MATKILIVDDHPMTVAAYVNLLTEINLGPFPAKFITAYTCEQAYNMINIQNTMETPIDLALLDVSLPSFVLQNIMDGVDIGKHLRKRMPDCKIIIQTMHSEPLRIDNIINQLSPEGFISKNDIDFESFPKICQRIMNGDIYYSHTIEQAREEFAKFDIDFDLHDNKILNLLSQGVKTINLPDYIPLSLSTIEKRKATIKDQLLQGKGSDLELLQKARKLGLI
ncbi:response regulator [Flavobacterium ardleyense]|uniref:response regulator n=1 Tax=Flavobacterium ardleyense TaxID=2038737 RepID=UPI00298D5F80|nr:response regulator [Flavobacterium ardleyense]